MRCSRVDLAICQAGGRTGAADTKVCIEAVKRFPSKKKIKKKKRTLLN